IDTFYTAYFTANNKGIYLAPVLFDFSTTTSLHAGWNRINSTSNDPFQIEDVIDYNGINTGVAFTMTSPFKSQSTVGPTESVTLWGIDIPEEIIHTSLYNNANNYAHASFKFSKLNPEVSYDFCFFASRLNLTERRIT